MDRAHLILLLHVLPLRRWNIKKIVSCTFALLVFLFIFVVSTWYFTRQVWNDETIEMESLWRSKGYKTILAYDIPSSFNIKDGDILFHELKCAETRCRLTTNNFERPRADLVLFHEKYVPTLYMRSPHQIYALNYMDSPLYTSVFPYPDIINWTITYRHDSTIPAPHRIWRSYDSDIRKLRQYRNFAEGKTKQVAWFVSNCNDKNGRMEYAKELSKYIRVDIYGECGKFNCPRDTTEECFEMLERDYKFYLAFENSNCIEYITDKLFENALSHNILPIVMGAPQADYDTYAPTDSFIHVDAFESPKRLAGFLHHLDKYDFLYNEYFRWQGTGEILNEPKAYFCDLCARLHDDMLLVEPEWYADVNEWWRNKPRTCTKGNWKDPEPLGSSTIKRANYIVIFLALFTRWFDS